MTKVIAASSIVHFESAEHDGPHGYGAFLDDGHTEDVARLRQEAVAVDRQFLPPLNSAT